MVTAFFEDERCELGKRKGAVEMNHDGNDGWRNEIFGPAPTYQEIIPCAHAHSVDPFRRTRDNVGMIIEDQDDAGDLVTVDPRVQEFRRCHSEATRIYMIAPKLYGGHHAHDNSTATASATAAATAIATAQVRTRS